MQLFNSTAAFHWSYRTYMLDGDFRQFLHFFEGPVPTTFADIPFDLNDYYEIFRQCSYSQIVHCYNADDDGNQSTDQYSRIASQGPIDGVRKHYYRPIFDRWELMPREIIHGGYRDENTGLALNVSAHQDDENQLRSLHFAYYYSNVYRADFRDYLKYSNNYEGGVPWNRSAQNAPLIFEYDQEVTINAFEYVTWTSSSNAPGFYDLEIWDETLNEGAGGWVLVIDDRQMWDTPYSTLMRPIYELGGSYTSRRFKFRFSDTGGGSWAFNHIALIGDEPTWGKETVDLTWALLGGFHNARGGYYDRNQSDSFNEPGGFPWAIVDVGGPGSGATVELEKATGLIGGETPNIESFTLQFKDN